MAFNFDSLDASQGRPIFKIATVTATYLGARAKTTTIHHDKSRLGLRTIVMEWIDDATSGNGGHPAGTVTRKVVKGDAWRGVGATAYVEIEAEMVIA